MADLTLEEYRNTASPGKHVNQFLREEAEKSFGADSRRGIPGKKAYGRYAKVRGRGSQKFKGRRLRRIEETAENP
jgi:hypothetical protein